MKDKGCIQVYTGDGKGKTTAALGLALRALCAGYRVFVGQFMKGRECSESRAASFFDGLTAERFGEPEFVMGRPSARDLASARAGLARMEEILASGDYDVVIFDEVLVAVSLGLLAEEAVLAVLAKRPACTEVVLTGRGASEALMNAADLVTEMREIKHYYRRGVPARRGIEE